MDAQKKIELLIIRYEKQSKIAKGESERFAKKLRAKPNDPEYREWKNEYLLQFRCFEMILDDLKSE